MPVDLTFEPLSTAKAAVTVIIGRQHNLAGMFEGATAVGSMNAALWRTMVEKVKPGDALGTAWHYWHKPDGKRIFNHAHFFEVRSVSENAAKVEADHTLIWASLADCIARLRHEASAWALTRWVRINGSGYPRSSG